MIHTKEKLTHQPQPELMSGQLGGCWWFSHPATNTDKRSVYFFFVSVWRRLWLCHKGTPDCEKGAAVKNKKITERRRWRGRRGHSLVFEQVYLYRQRLQTVSPATPGEFCTCSQQSDSHSRKVQAESVWESPAERKELIPWRSLSWQEKQEVFLLCFFYVKWSQL